MEDNIAGFLSDIQNFVKKNKDKGEEVKAKCNGIKQQISPLNALLSEWELKMFLRPPNSASTPQNQATESEKMTEISEMPSWFDQTPSEMQSEIKQETISTLVLESKVFLP